MTVSLVGYTNAGKSTLLEHADRRRTCSPTTSCSPRSTPAPAAGSCPDWGPVLLSRHGRFHPRPAPPSDRQLQGDARRSPAGRPAAARRRRQQSGRPGADRGRVPRARKSSASARRTRSWCSTRSIGSPSPACSTRCCGTTRTPIPVSAQDRRGPVATGRRRERLRSRSISSTSTSKPTSPTAGCWPIWPSTAKSSAARSPATACRSIAGCRRSTPAGFARTRRPSASAIG